MTALRRAISALRYLNDEQIRAMEAITRSARFPQPRPRPEDPTRARGADAPAGSPTDAAAPDGSSQAA